MNLDKETLEDANCWFTTDHVPHDPETTLFKREARYRQALWRQSQGLGAGSHGNTRKSVAAGRPATIPNGSKLKTSDAEAGMNFLSPKIWAAAQNRMCTPEKHETLSKTRLKADLLSSMPMCFNLLGEVSGDLDRARRAADLLLPQAQSGPVEVKFEWSPGRRCAEYTNDRTAFDAALVIGAEGGPRQVIGIETKYHEHVLREKKPKPTQVQRHARQRDHYRKITETSGIFKPGWESLLDTELEQIWRDHLLLLSMLQQPAEWSGGCYLLVYPSRNPSFRAAAQQYGDLLVENDSTFRAITIEELIQADVLHEPATAKDFTERYLWWLAESER